MINLSDYRETPSGTFYRVGTSDEVIFVLERARVNRTRLAIVYRDDSVPEFGRVGRSTGELKVPLLVHNMRSTGGSEICTRIIRAISTSDGQQLLYREGA